MTPKMLQTECDMVKEALHDKNGKFGVDLAIPQIGGSARKTNHDYTHGKLPELTDIIIKEKAALFVSAVGVPPKWMVDKLHEAGIPVMNMVGHPHHVEKALEAGVDMICAQGTEGGGHTGEVATTVLLPMCVDACKGKLSPLTGKPVSVVAGGGIYDGRGLAMCLALGADAVWVGTRFVASVEGGATDGHKKAICEACLQDTHRSLVFTGRPMRVLKTRYTMEWEDSRAEECKTDLKNGVLPWYKDSEAEDRGHYEDDKARKIPEDIPAGLPHLSGQVAGAIQEVLSCAQIVELMVNEAGDVMSKNHSMMSKL